MVSYLFLLSEGVSQLDHSARAQISGSTLIDTGKKKKRFNTKSSTPIMTFDLKISHILLTLHWEIMPLRIAVTYAT